jgi:hypothetical protein
LQAITTVLWANLAQKGLESKLTAAMHSLELLKEAVAGEERGLQADHTLLEDLERDSRAEERIWRQRAKKVGVSSAVRTITLTTLDAPLAGATGNGGSG